MFHYLTSYSLFGHFIFISCGLQTILHENDICTQFWWHIDWLQPFIFRVFLGVFSNWRDAPQQDTVPWCSHLWRPEESRLWRSAGLSPSLRGVSPCRLCRPESRFSARSHLWCSRAARNNGNHQKCDFYTSGRLGDVKLAHLICPVAMVMVSNKFWWCDWWMKWKRGSWLKYVWIKLTHRGKKRGCTEHDT